MATAALVGATGLVGTQIYNTLNSLNTVKKVFAFSRKELAADAKVTPIVTTESTEWTKQYPAGADIFFSALGTTRANAGGFENQRKIDYDLNVELAQAARAAGTRIYVLISSSGANSASKISYTKMKGELEDAISAIDFDHVVIVRPGLIVGERMENRAFESALQKVAGWASAVGGSRMKDFWAQDDLVIARAAVRAGLDCVEGKETEKVRVLAQSDVVRLGRTEWQS